MQSFIDLEVWQDARALSVSVYRLTDGFPPSERFSLTNQVRRAAVSIAANLAEGALRRTNTDFSRFVNIAQGSCAELTCLLLLALDLTYASPAEVDALVAECQRLARRLNKLHTRLTE